MIPTETSIVHTETTVLINMHLTSFAPIWYSPILPFSALLFHIFTAADASHLQESQPREVTDPTHFAKAKWAIESGRESYSHLLSMRITMPLQYACSHMPNLIPWSGIIQPCLNYQPYQREHSTRMSPFSWTMYIHQMVDIAYKSHSPRFWVLWASGGIPLRSHANPWHFLFRALNLMLPHPRPQRQGYSVMMEGLKTFVKNSIRPSRQ